MSVASGLVHRGLAWLFILLAFVGWVLMLSGVAALQQACNSNPSFGNIVTETVGMEGNPLVGTAGYLAPVGCDKVFSYTWWNVAFHLVVLLLLAAGATTLIGTMRGTMVALSATLLVLLMDTANTYLYFNDIPGITGSVPARARVLVAGSIISSIAFFCIIAIIGWHDEDTSLMAKPDTEAAGKKRAPVKKKGGFLGGLFGGSAARQEEETPGTGAVGSPRMVQVPHAPVVPTSSSAYAGSPPYAGPATCAGPDHPHTTTTTTTTAYTAQMPAPVATTTYSPASVPVSTTAAPVPTRVA